jgi:hypothetical protein
MWSKKVSLGALRVFWRNYHTRFEAQQDVLNYISMLSKANGIDIWAT